MPLKPNYDLVENLERNMKKKDSFLLIASIRFRDIEA